MLKLLRLILAVLWLAGGVSVALANTAAENRAFKEARSAFDDKFWERAERQFALFVEKFPGSTLAPEAVLYRAQALSQLGRLAEAIPLIEERKATAGAQTDRYLYWIGEARLRGRDYAASAEAFAELTRDFPQSSFNLEAIVSEAEARARLGGWKRAAEILAMPEGAFQKRIHSGNGAATWIVRGKLVLARARLELGEFDVASSVIQTLTGAILDEDQKWQLKYITAGIELAAGRFAQAETASTDLVLQAGLTRKPELTAQSWSFRGRVFEKLNQTDKALDAYGHNLLPTAPVEQQREALGRLARLHLARGDVAKGMEVLETFLARSTNSVAADVALLELAELHLKQQLAGSTSTNHLDQALGWLDQLIAGSRDATSLGRAWLNRGWCYWVSNQPALSRAAFVEAASKLPPSENLVVAHFKAGDAAFAMNDFSAARESYRMALKVAEQFPEATAELSSQAWYQLGRACLAMKDVAGAEQVVRQMLRAPSPPALAQRSLLLTAQGLAQADQPEVAKELFKEFAARFPDSELGPQAELASARVLERQGDWRGALAMYQGWTSRNTNHVLLPDAEFHRAMVLARLGEETNTFVQLTNFVTAHPRHELVPAARFWLGDYLFGLGDFAEAEKHFSLLYHGSPLSPLALEASMMAGRAAIGWSGYRNAINHFTNITSNPNCPAELKVAALFAYGSALRLEAHPDSTNQIAALKLAAEVFSVIQRENPGKPEAAAAAVERGNAYFQLGSLDANYFPEALVAYNDAMTNAIAPPAVRGEAGVGSGKTSERLAAGLPAESKSLRASAMNLYLDVLYDESGDPMVRKQAGLEAVRLGRELAEWEQVARLCERMQKLFPPLKASLEKRRIEALEKTRGEKPLTNGKN
jgi:TolA-binding protein